MPAVRLAHLTRAALTALTLSVAAGCHSASEASPANFTKGLVKYLADHPDCLYKQAPPIPLRDLR